MRRVAMDLATTVERIQQNFCICDPNLPDNPIVFASDGFLEMSRYDRFEVLGRNCRFMQARRLRSFSVPCFMIAHARLSWLLHACMQLVPLRSCFISISLQHVAIQAPSSAVLCISCWRQLHASAGCGQFACSVG